MTPFKFLFTCISHKTTPVKATNLSLDSWCYRSSTWSTRFIQKIEMCTALCAGDDAWGMPLGKSHRHTLLRVILSPTHGTPGASEDALLIERVRSAGGAYHSVTPIAETFSVGDTLFYPDIHDRVCVITRGLPTALAHDLEVERTLTFGDQICLTVAQFARILAFVSRATKQIRDGGDCRFKSRSFAFTCLAALTPTLPPRKIGERTDIRVASGAKMVNDSVFELSAEQFLVHAPRFFRSRGAVEALELIEMFRGEPREGVNMGLYH